MDARTLTLEQNCGDISPQKPSGKGILASRFQIGNFVWILLILMLDLPISKMFNFKF